MPEHRFGDDEPTVVDDPVTPRIDLRTMAGYHLGVRDACRAWIVVAIAGLTDPKHAHAVAAEIERALLGAR